MGFGDDGPDGGPANMTLPMVPMFQILGPTNNPFPGTICLPQVPLPKNTTVKAGDKATIQVVELAVHGAALYSVCYMLLIYSGIHDLTKAVCRHYFRRTRRQEAQRSERDQLLQLD